MDSDFPSPLLVVAAHLAVVVAVVHLTLGVYNWLRYAAAGFLVPPDVRWPLFVISGLFLVAGLVLAVQGRYRRPLYLGGVVLMMGYVVGYFGWHFSGHRPLFFLGPGTPHHGPFVPFLLDHLFAGPVEFLTIVSEVALAVILLYLLVTGSE